MDACDIMEIPYQSPKQYYHDAFDFLEFLPPRSEPV